MTVSNEAKQAAREIAPHFSAEGREASARIIQRTFNVFAAERDKTIAELTAEKDAYKRIVIEDSEFGALFQPDGEFHELARLPLGKSAVVEGGKWLVAQLSDLTRKLEEHPVSVEEANELANILCTLTNSGTALKTSARELVSVVRRKDAAFLGLITERDALRSSLEEVTKERDANRQTADSQQRVAIQMQAERDAALAALAKLKSEKTSH